MTVSVRPGTFDDRTVTLSGQPDLLARLAEILGSRTRLAVLETLIRSGEPLHINEIARRVGVDASPVRTHLEILAKEGLVTEVSNVSGRERRFATRLEDVHLTLAGVHRAAADRTGPAPKAVQKLVRKLADMERDRAKLEERARKLQREIEVAWAKAAPK